MADKVVRTVCQGCHPECGVLAHVKDGKVVRLDGDPAHPMSRGFICVRGRAQQSFVYHPDRLKYPLRRAGKRGEGKWQRLSWEEALSDIAERLTRVKEKYSAHAIATMRGTGPRAAGTATRFLAAALNTPNVISTDNHICYAPSIVAESCTYGQAISQEKGPDYPNSNCILVCGGNPLVSHPPRGLEIMEAKRKRQAKLIVIDPRRTQMADAADLWLQIRPGTDLALLMSLLNVIISEELFDREFVSNWCVGFDKLSEHVRNYPPDKVADITWIPADKIREAARMYATTRPAAIHHRVAVEHNINSTQTDRAIAILAAVTGNIDVKGGNLLSTSVDGFIHTAQVMAGKQFKLDADTESLRLGAKQFPLIAGSEAKHNFVHAGLAVEAMLHEKPYPLKVLYCAGGNPVVNMQNCREVWQALHNIDLSIVVDYFMTPGAEIADFVLPAAMWLERDECCDLMYTNYIAARQKVIEPLYECWDDLKIAIELIKKLPWAHHERLPWDSVKQFNEWRVKGMGMNFAGFAEKGYIVPPLLYHRYEKQGFNTPSKKVELYSSIFEKYGYDPLPIYHEPPETPVSAPELLKEYCLILITGGRYRAYYHSDGRQIPELRKLVPDPEIEIHPDTAKKAGIKNGDWIWIETPRLRGARAKFKAKLTDSLDPRVVHAAHAWWFPEKPAPEHGCFESNINSVLSMDPPLEPICGSVPTRGTLCRIYPDK